MDKGMSERHFFRCGNCCLVYAFEGDSRKIGWNGRGYSVPPTPPACDCGAGSAAKIAGGKARSMKRRGEGPAERKP